MNDPTMRANDRFVEGTQTGGSIIFNHDFLVGALGIVTLFLGDIQFMFATDYSAI
jgi:hypothetical protein